MKLYPMKRSAAEKKEREKDYPKGTLTASDDHDGPRLHLSEDHLDKMGMKDKLAPGDTYHFEGHAKVVHSSENADEHGKRRHVELHIHKLGAEKADGKSLRDEIKDAADRKTEK